MFHRLLVLVTISAAAEKGREHVLVRILKNTAVNICGTIELSLNTLQASWFGREFWLTSDNL